MAEEVIEEATEGEVMEDKRMAQYGLLRNYRLRMPPRPVYP